MKIDSAGQSQPGFEYDKHSGSGIQVTSQTVIEYEDLPVRIHKPAFAEDLEQSWVYQRNESGLRHSMFSASSSVAGTGHWSMLSGLSMAEVSNVSVINLPILYQEVHKVFRNGSFTTDKESVTSGNSSSQCNACRKLIPAYEKGSYTNGNICSRDTQLNIADL